MKQSFKLIYIAGSGRSGSTILDILLSQQTGVVGLGELINVFKSGWINNEYCSCGKRANDCSFWNKVRVMWEENSNLSIEEYAKVQKKYRRIYALPRLFFLHFFKSKEFKRFTEDTWLLYETISNVSQCEVLIDSSKSVFWLYALKLMNIKINILHLVRDGRAAMSSLRRPFKKDLKAGVQHDLKPHPSYLVGIHWVIDNLIVEIVKIKTSNVFIRYEDLISIPEDTLFNISNTFDIQLGEVQDIIRRGIPLTKAHVIAGNRLRMQKELILKRSNNPYIDLKSISKKDKLQFDLIAYFLLKKYKYL